MTKVDYGGGGVSQMAGIDQQINLCVWGAPVYKGGEEERAGQGRGAPKGGQSYSK